MRIYSHDKAIQIATKARCRRLATETNNKFNFYFRNYENNSLRIIYIYILHTKKFCYIQFWNFPRDLWSFISDRFATTLATSLSPTCQDRAFPISPPYIFQGASHDRKIANAMRMVSSIWLCHLGLTNTLGGTTFSEDITGRSKNHAGPSILFAVTAWFHSRERNLYARP